MSYKNPHRWLIVALKEAGYSEEQLADSFASLALPYNKQETLPSDERPEESLDLVVRWLKGEDVPSVASAMNDILLSPSVFTAVKSVMIKGVSALQVKTLLVVSRGLVLADGAEKILGDILFNTSGMTRQDWWDYADDCFKKGIKYGGEIKAIMEQSLYKVELTYGLVPEIKFLDLLKLIMSAAFLSLQEDIQNNKHMDTTELLKLALRAGEAYAKLNDTHESPLTTLALNLEYVKENPVKYKDSKDIFGDIFH